jgi:hypothetical protein
VASRFVVTSSNYAPVPGTAVTITAQLADSSGAAVPTSGISVAWSSTGGGTFSSATTATNVSGVATVTFTVSATTGTVHTVTATGGGYTGTTSNITVTANPAIISLVRSTGMVTYGQSARLAAQIAANGANRPVYLEYTYAGSPWTTVASTTTNSTGFASATYKPARSGYYRVRFAGTPDLSAAYSNVVLIGVRQVITLNPTHSGTLTIARGREIIFRGTVKPQGLAGVQPTVTFRFYQRRSGVWTRRATRNVVADSTGVARTTFRFAVSGSWYVMAFANTTSVNAVSRFSQREYFLVR